MKKKPLSAEVFDEDIYSIYGLDSKESGNKQHVAYNYLKKKIVSGQYPSEKPLIERELCELLGVSRTPVREALRRLSSEGLVSSYPGRGVFVSRVSLDHSIQMHEYKEALEAMAALLCCERMTQGELQMLHDAMLAQKKSYDEGDALSSINHDMRFHHILLMGSHSEMLIEQGKTLTWQARRYAQLTTYDTQYTMKFVEEHSEIYEAIRAKDSSRAERAVHAHTATVKLFQRERWGLLFGQGE